MTSARTVLAVATVLAGVLTGAACAPITTTPEQGVPTPPAANSNPACNPGWVCGACPNGDQWGYDPTSPANNDGPDFNTVIFDPRHPCQDG
jgi:hypothetical protein